MTTFFAQSAGVPDWHGSLRQCASLGAQAAALGHTVRLMAPQFVKPYVKTNKNDAADAEAICEAVADRTCASCRSRASSSRRYWRCTGRARDS